MELFGNGSYADVSETTTIYDDDLAYIQDVGFSDLSDAWAAGLLGIFRESGIESGTIVDLGCGGGGRIEHVNNAGYHAVGVDVSAAMIERSRRRVASAEFHVGSLWNFAFPSCRAVTALGEVVCYRTEGCDDPNLRSMFAQVFDALEPAACSFLTLPRSDSTVIEIALLLKATIGRALSDMSMRNGDTDSTDTSRHFAK